MQTQDMVFVKIGTLVKHAQTIAMPASVPSRGDKDMFEHGRCLWRRSRANLAMLPATILALGCGTGRKLVTCNYAELSKPRDCS